MGTAANADAHRPRPQSASDRSTPSQVGSQSFACSLAPVLQKKGKDCASLMRSQVLYQAAQECCRTKTVSTCWWKHSVGMPAADLHACLMGFLYTAYSFGMS